MCVNGAYSSQLAVGSSEGLWMATENASAPILVATRGDDGQPAFTLTRDETTLLWSSSEIGTGWTSVGVNDEERAAIHARCDDLESRTWWR